MSDYKLSKNLVDILPNYTYQRKLLKKRTEIRATNQDINSCTLQLRNLNITRKELAQEIGISEDGIKFNLKKEGITIQNIRGELKVEIK